MSLIPSLLGGPATGSVGVADLINQALKVLGVLAAGESPAAADQTDALKALNRMMDTWANQRLALYATQRSTYALTAGTNPHTIGASADPTAGGFVDTRPVRIDRASLILSGQANSELPLNILSDAEWQGTQGKATAGQPVSLWVEMGFPLVSLWLNPVPSAADTLVLYTPMQLGRFSSANSTLDMPPGYEEAIVYNLALRLCPLYGVQLSAEAREIASESLTALKRTNTQESYLRSDAAILGGGRFNLISGDQ